MDSEQTTDATATGTTGVHPILGCAVEVAAALGRVAEVSPIFMSPADKKAALIALGRHEARLAELRLRVLAAAETAKLGDATGACSTAAYVASATRQTRESAAADVRFAASLDTEFDATRLALAAGVVNVAQAKVIVAAIGQITDRVGPADRLRAEAHLIEQAQGFDATELRRLGKRLFEVLDPDAADEQEGKDLNREERRARRQAMLSMRSNGDGSHSGVFKLPDLHAAILKKALQGLTAPRRLGAGRFDADGKKLPYRSLLGHGFMELLEKLPADALPTAGGTNASIVVTMDLAALLSGIGAATLDDGTRISAAEARRLACEARIIPLVLGGDSQPLDVGLGRRLFSSYQRVALAQRDGGCTAEDCDRPPGWCEAHHDLPWSEGGPTDLNNGRLYCEHHHGLAHDDAYIKTRLPNGAVRFRRRQ